MLKLFVSFSEILRFSAMKSPCRYRPLQIVSNVMFHYLGVTLLFLYNKLKVMYVSDVLKI